MGCFLQFCPLGVGGAAEAQERWSIERPSRRARGVQGRASLWSFKSGAQSSLFYSFFKSLVGKDVVVELKNDLSICGTLHSVDQYLNIKLTDISVTDPEKYPHMLSVKNCFIRGSVVRYVQLPADEVDTQLLQDAARKEALQQKQ
uniref:U6 snRNA-associated Sm-like protein LSm2 n=1 Tax=Ursus maritimus TaxID=29073 RepID=A0A452UBT2_URSMA